MAITNNNKTICRHDYINAIKIGNIDYICPLCKELLDPLEWFFMNSFDFVDVKIETDKKDVKGSESDIKVGGNIAGGAREKLQKES